MKKAIKRLQNLEEQSSDVQNQVEFLVDMLNILYVSFSLLKHML